MDDASERAIEEDMLDQFNYFDDEDEELIDRRETGAGLTSHPTRQARLADDRVAGDDQLIDGQLFRELRPGGRRTCHPQAVALARMQERRREPVRQEQTKGHQRDQSLHTRRNGRHLGT